MLAFVICNANAQVKVKALNGFGFGTRCTFHVEETEHQNLQLIVTLVGELKGQKTYSELEKWGGTDYHKEAAIFSLSYEQLLMIAKGVKKLRLDTQPKFFEKEWRNGKFGKQLYKDYQKSKF